MPAYNKPVRNHCKAGFCVGQTRIRNKSLVSGLLWSDMKTMVSHTKLTVPSAAPRELSRCVNPNQLKTGRLESNLRLCGELSDQLKILFPDGDDEGTIVVPALDARSQVLSIKDPRNGVRKPVFKFAPFGSRQLFTLVSPDLSVPGVFS